MLENIQLDKLTFFDAVIFAYAYKVFIEGKHVQPNALDLFLKIQENFYEKKPFTKFEIGKFAGEIKVGLINEIVNADNSDKLYVEQVMFDRERQIVSGLRDKVNSLDLIDRSFLFLTNIKPRKVGGNLSEGMILCAKDDSKFEILSVEGCKPGAKLHYNDSFPVVETFTVPNLDLQSEKGKIFLSNLVVKDNVLCFKDCPLYCENKKIVTKIVKDGSVS